ncbi:MAG: sulfotransferase, partial [Planctomycetes bacterium]|nr:sulfotransferase [Planctomycetota bacterium]
YGFWDFYCNGFSQPCRDLLSTDVTGGMMNVKSAIAQITTKKRDNLLIRITGWPRMGFLQKIFGPAKFIHVLRDGRGFANSIMNQPWWRGWQGPDNWRWGELTESQRSEWEKHNKSFVALAGIQWNILMDAFEKSAEEIDPENYTVVKYEDLCSDPVDTYRKVTEFCDLEWSNQFEKAICKYSLRSLNEKWKREFTDKQIEILESVTGDYLGKYGYI